MRHFLEKYMNARTRANITIASAWRGTTKRNDESDALQDETTVSKDEREKVSAMADEAMAVSRKKTNFAAHKGKSHTH